jgi:hypothetical protein
MRKHIGHRRTHVHTDARAWTRAGSGDTKVCAVTESVCTLRVAQQQLKN